MSDYIYQILTVLALFGGKVPTATFQGYASAQGWDTEVLNSEAISTSPRDLQKNVRTVHITFIKWYSQRKQMQIDSQENAEGKNANKCSLGRLHASFSSVHSLCLSIIRTAFGHSMSPKSLCKHSSTSPLTSSGSPQNFDVLKNLIITGNFKRSQ